MPVPAQSKIVKKGNSEPDQFELSIAQALLELQNNSDLKAQLRELYITKAKEIELFGKKVSHRSQSVGSEGTYWGGAVENMLSSPILCLTVFFILTNFCLLVHTIDNSIFNYAHLYVLSYRRVPNVIILLMFKQHFILHPC